MTSEVEKLRALLAEAREVVASVAETGNADYDLKQRIDAALAEPRECTRCDESEHAMHLRIRAGYDKAVADSWRAKVADVEKERDEARAERDRYKAALDAELPVAWREDIQSLNSCVERIGKERDEARTEVERLREEIRFLREEAIPAARATSYERGAEAMREAVASAVLPSMAPVIRALPIPQGQVMSDVPMLKCPECGDPLIPATGRGRYDDDGNYLEHRDGCRCPWCGWMWFDDHPPTTCGCGAIVTVEVDNESAYARVKR